MPREKIDDVRERTNIVEVIRRYVELKRAGAGSWKGLCPFHAEKTPSFHVHEGRQFFHCFGCGEKGDVFTFVEKMEQRPFVEVLRDLASAAGIEVDAQPLSPAERKARTEAESERARLLRTADLAALFFQQTLASPAGAAARAYVESRGIGSEVAGRFRVGYAPARWDGLQAFLASHKVPPADAERLGLVGAGERGRYDFFRDRVMLPVIDRQKRVIGFGGRLLDPQAKDRKYVNSPDSPLFHKKEQLYGLHVAVDAIRRTGTAVVVEGNFDVLTLHQAGVDETVAPMGTALTGEQVGTLARMARRVVVVFDGDAAGQRAAEKAIPLLVEAGVDGRVARLPSGQDPDDFVRASGAEAFRRLLDNARPALDHFIQSAVDDPTIPGQVSALERIAALLIKVKDDTARELYVRQVAAVLRLDPKQVLRAMRSAAEAAEPRRAPTANASVPAPEQPARATAPVRPPPREELHFVALVASYPELVHTPDATRGGELLVDPSMRQLFRAASEQVQATGRLDVPAWLDVVPAPIRELLSRALVDDGVARPPDPAAQLGKLCARLQLMRLEAEIAMNVSLEKDARARGDEATVRAILIRGIELRQTKQGLETALQRP